MMYFPLSISSAIFHSELLIRQCDIPHPKHQSTKIPGIFHFSPIKYLRPTRMKSPAKCERCQISKLVNYRLSSMQLILFVKRIPRQHSIREPFIILWTFSSCKSCQARVCSVDQFLSRPLQKYIRISILVCKNDQRKGHCAISAFGTIIKMCFTANIAVVISFEFG